MLAAPVAIVQSEQSGTPDTRVSTTGAQTSVATGFRPSSGESLPPRATDLVLALAQEQSLQSPTIQIPGCSSQAQAQA